MSNIQEALDDEEFGNVDGDYNPLSNTSIQSNVHIGSSSERNQQPVEEDKQKCVPSSLSLDPSLEPNTTSISIASAAAAISKPVYAPMSTPVQTPVLVPASAPKPTVLSTSSTIPSKAAASVLESTSVSAHAPTHVSDSISAATTTHSFVEKKALRAAKFGIPPSFEDKKIQRAARFGSAESAKSTYINVEHNPLNSNSQNGSIPAKCETYSSINAGFEAKLKARAEKFALTVAKSVDAVQNKSVNINTISDSNNAEAKKNARALRFNSGFTAPTDKVLEEMEEKKRRRIEKFSCSGTTGV